MSRPRANVDPRSVIIINNIIDAIIVDGKQEVVVFGCRALDVEQQVYDFFSRSVFFKTDSESQSLSSQRYWRKFDEQRVRVRFFPSEVNHWESRGLSADHIIVVNLVDIRKKLFVEIVLPLAMRKIASASIVLYKDDWDRHAEIIMPLKEWALRQHQLQQSTNPPPATRWSGYLLPVWQELEDWEMKQT